METHEILHDAGSRRAFFRASGVTLVGGSAMFLAACGSGSKSSAGKAPGGGGGSEQDVAILNSALDLENMAIYVYTNGARLLRGEALKVGKSFLGHEKAHAQGIERAIQSLGGTPNKPKPAYDVSKPTSQLQVLDLAEKIENVAVAAYIDAIPKLTDPKLRATAAAIATTEAEHIAVLRKALGRRAVPTAFVSGSRSA
jgi:rubrerythrin